MAKKQGGLGRDFYSVLDDNMLDIKSDTYVELPLTSIQPRKGQPRTHFDEDALNALAESIREHGVIQPIAVREMAYQSGTYEIIAGERRWRASKIAEKETIPAVILSGDDLKVAQLSLVENVQREDLNPVEEALAYKTLINSFDLTQDQVAQQAGRSRPYIANMLRLLDLPEEVLQLLKDKALTIGHARALLALENVEDIFNLANTVVEKELSVRETEKAVKLILDRANAPEVQPKEEASSQKDVYMQGIEERAMLALGRRVRINSSKRKKTIELSYENDDDLEAILKLLCGEEFFN